MIRVSTLLMLLAALGAGCAGTQEIETSPPQPRSDMPADDDASAREAPFGIVMAPGETALPDDVSRLRFRIAEVRLRSPNGRWVRLPSDAAPIEITSDETDARRTLLDSRIAPETYDSLEVVFDDVFVLFGENAGGPVTVPGDAPQRLALELRPALDTHTTLILRIELGPSLTRSPDCRWFFIPLLRTDVTETALAPSDDARG